MKHGARRAPLRRLLAALVAVCLLAGIAPAALAEDGPNIPYGKDLSGYDPNRDGYYGYIPVCVVSGEGQANARLPVLVYGERVYVDPDCLGLLFTDVVVDADEDDVLIMTDTRRLEMAAGDLSAQFIISSRFDTDSILSKTSVRLSGAPCRSNERLWVPLSDTLGLLSIDYVVLYATGLGRALVLYAPRRRAIDVLADLRSAAGLSQYWYEFPETDRFTELCLLFSAGLSLSVDRAMSFDITKIIRQASGTNIAPFLDIVAGTSQEELFELTSQYFDEMGEVFPLANEVLSIEACAPVIDDLLGTAMAGISATVIGASYADAYTRRDELAIRSLETFSALSRAESMTGRMKSAFDSAVSNMRDMKTYATANMVEGSWQKFTDQIGQTLIDELGKRKLAGTAGALVETFSLAGDISLAYNAVSILLKGAFPGWKNKMDDMEAFEKAAYGYLLQTDARTLLEDTLDTLSRGTIEAEDIDRGMLAAYLYMKTFAALSVTADRALGFDEKADYSPSYLVKQACADMSILSTAYDRDKLDSLTPGEIARQAVTVGQYPFIRATVPLYTRADGKVLKKDTEEPVEDAEVSFTFDGHACGHVSGTPGGILGEVCVPLAIPGPNAVEFNDTDLLAHFTSPSVDGKDTVAAAVNFSGGTPLPTAYLGKRVEPAVVLLNDLIEVSDETREGHLTLPNLVAGACPGADEIRRDLKAFSEDITTTFEKMSGAASQANTDEYDDRDHWDEWDAEDSELFGWYDDGPNYGDYDGSYDDYDGPNYGDYDGPYDDEGYGAYYGDGPANGLTLQYAYTVNDTFATRRVLALRLTETSFFAGSARPVHETRNLSYDLATGKRLTVPDLLDPDADGAAERLIQLIAERYAKYEGELWITPREVGELVAAGSAGRWVFTPEGWLLYFDYEEIALSISGTLDEVFSCEALEGIFQEDFLSQATPKGDGSVCAIAPDDDRFQNEDYTVYGTPDPDGLILALDGMGAQVSVVAPTVGMNNYQTELFYADLLADAVVCLPAVSSGEYTVRWTDDGGTHETTLYAGLASQE